MHGHEVFKIDLRPYLNKTNNYLEVFVSFIPILTAGDISPHFVAGGLYVRRCCKEFKQEGATKTHRKGGRGGRHTVQCISFGTRRRSEFSFMTRPCNPGKEGLIFIEKEAGWTPTLEAVSTSRSREKSITVETLPQLTNCHKHKSLEHP